MQLNISLNDFIRLYNRIRNEIHMESVHKFMEMSKIKYERKLILLSRSETR